MFEYKAKLYRVVDGDTVIVEILHRERVEDLGFHLTIYNEPITSKQSLRLSGMDAPELFSGENRVAGAASRDFVVQWLEKSLQNKKDEWHLFVKTYKDKKSFNRYIADVYDVATGANLGQDIVAAGFGTLEQYAITVEQVQEQAKKSPLYPYVPPV